LLCPLSADHHSYWYKSDKLPQPPNGHKTSPAIKQESDDTEMQGTAEPEIDVEELKKRQEEAQRKHEEAKKQREETEKKKLELDEKLKLMELERKKMAEKLAKKAVRRSSDSPKDLETDQQTKELKATLDKLQAEATTLGINGESQEASNGFGTPGYRGRGGFRGRGAPRGRGSYYGGYRGGFGGYATVPPVKRLDNRPKTVAITFNSGDCGPGEEVIRQYLMFNSLESATLSKHPEREDTALVAFQQRFEGENFIAAATGFSDLARQLGKVQVSWYTGAVGQQNDAMDGSNGHAASDDVQMNGGSEIEAPPVEQSAPKDLDTYDENDEWN
jgi:RNA-binding protein 26